jgi:Domain of unknown function (DUF4386)
MMDTVEVTSPQRLARIAGILYLINILGGAFAIGFVHATVFTSDPVTTATNIQEHQLLYRTGLAVHVVVTVTNVALALIFYELFKAVNRRLALLAAFFILVATAIEAAGLLNEFAPLVLLGDGSGTTALPGSPLAESAWLYVQLSQVHYTLYTVFFGLDILCLAYLVLQSRLLPRAIAVLLAVDGLAYLVYSFSDFLAPGWTPHLTPWIQLPAPLAEGAFSLWLITFGLNAAQRTPRVTDGTQLLLPSVETRVMHPGSFDTTHPQKADPDERTRTHH